MSRFFDSARHFHHAVGKSRLAVIDVSDNTKIPDILLFHILTCLAKYDFSRLYEYRIDFR